MYKFIIYPLLIVILLYANLDQLHNHASLLQYYKYKYAINRATHAATLQIDRLALAEGLVLIDEEQANIVAHDILSKNLVGQDYRVVMFEVVQVDSNAAPYHYINRQWDIESYFYEPAVIMVVETTYQHLIPNTNNYNWKIFGTSEVITSFK